MRLGAAHTDPVRVYLKMFEQMTKDQHPWTQRDNKTGKVRRFGFCPECNNPMQLISIDVPQPGSTPHGRHCPDPVPGFSTDLQTMLGCSLYEPSKRSELAAENMRLTPEAIVRREFLATHFNLALGILQEDIGISISRNLADKILETWFEDRWYRWKDANLGNLPWLFARTTIAYNLYGQQLRPGSDTCKAILSKVPEACLGHHNSILARPGKRFSLNFGVRNHEVTTDSTGARTETIIFNVLRPVLNIDTQPEVIFEKTITLRPEEFMARVRACGEPEGYGLTLVQMAQAALNRYLERHPEARTMTETASDDAARSGV